MNETLDDILNSIKPYILELPAGSGKVKYFGIPFSKNHVW